MTEPRYRPYPLGGEDGLPYSKGLLARALMGGGVAADRAYELALRVENDLVARGDSSVDFERLQDLAVATLGHEEGERVVRRLRRYSELQQLDRPIILLVGGATGTGKSTVATEAAHRLGIVRVTSTDFLRETMRAFFAKEFMPSIHFSSFEAGGALDLPDAPRPETTILGFVDQTRNVLVGVRASIDRALQEGWSMVLEGVHLVPGMLRLDDCPALVVQCVLAIEDEAEHADHFWVRDGATDGLRPVEKYLERLSDIRRLQEFIVSRADRHAVPVISERTVEDTIAAVIELVVTSANERLETV